MYACISTNVSACQIQCQSEDHSYCPFKTILFMVSTIERGSQFQT